LVTGELTFTFDSSTRNFDRAVQSREELAKLEGYKWNEVVDEEGYRRR